MEPLSAFDIILRVLAQLAPTWIALVAVFTISITYKRRLGLYGKLFDSPIGMVGFGMVMFWVFTAVFSASWVTIMSNAPKMAVKTHNITMPKPTMPMGLSNSLP